MSSLPKIRTSAHPYEYGGWVESGVTSYTYFWILVITEPEDWMSSMKESIDRKMRSSKDWALSHSSLLSPGDWEVRIGGVEGKPRVLYPSVWRVVELSTALSNFADRWVMWERDLTIGFNSVEVVDDPDKCLNAVGLEYM